jgi:predicted ATPase
MKIIELNIEGFRSLKSVSWKPGDLNLIIGPNGSGKSNLLKALNAFSALAQGRMSDQVVREGGMESLVWDGIPSEKVEFGLQFNKQESENIIRRWYYELIFRRLGSSSGYQIVQEELKYYPENAKSPYEIGVFQRQENKATLSRERMIQQTDENEIDNRKVGVFDKIPIENNVESILPLVASPFTDRPEITDIQKAISNWSIYQEFQTGREAPVRRAPVARRENIVSLDGSNLTQVIHTLYSGERRFKQDLDLAMHAAFKNDFEEIVFPPDADQRIQLRIRWKGLKNAQSAADLSDGTLRFLYLIAILANPNPPALIAIDEPENGLHPSMLPIIAEYARNASIRTQVILTTHSAELLDTFSEFDPTVTVSKWEEGQTTLKVVTKEQLQYWLEDYTLGKLFKTGGLEDME